jgi:hypothetical protein
MFIGHFTHHIFTHPRESAEGVEKLLILEFDSNFHLFPPLRQGRPRA